MRHRKLTKAEIAERLQEVGEGMVNASFVRDEKTYYELFEQRGKLQEALRELNSVADRISQAQ